MSLPTPDVPLDNACSSVYNNTLYVYTESAFQSLPLSSGAKWSQESMGVGVNGGVCVMAVPSDGSSPAMYVVGGAANSSMGEYLGLQRFRFNDKSWESLKPTAAVTQNRLYHNAAYLNSSSTILMYAGTQDGSEQISSQTFTIQTTYPYNVLAFESSAPPAISPLIVAWSDSEAAMLGGSDSNTKVMLFSESEGWQNSNASLSAPLKNITYVQAVVVTGDDGSKNLLTFDMSQSPNIVNRTVLVDQNGNAMQNAQPVSSRAVEGSVALDESSIRATKRLKRDDSLTENSWPTYNSTYAPTATRTSYALSEDSNGLVVMCGGGDSDDVLCMFDSRQNSWLNATQQLAATSGGPQSSATASATSTSASSSAATSPTSAAPPVATSSAASQGYTPSLTILGAVLGSVLGVASIILFLLLCLRWRKQKRLHAEAGHQRRASGVPSEEKEPMAYMDRDALYTGPIAGNRRHEPQSSANSFSSMAILMGNVGRGHKRGGYGKSDNGSKDSNTSSMFNKKYKAAISSPLPQEPVSNTRDFGSVMEEKEMSVGGVQEANAGATTTTPKSQPRGVSANARRGSTRRSSGWNRYWSGGSALNTLGFGSGNGNGNGGGGNNSRRTTYASDRTSNSEYSTDANNRRPSQATQSSALVAPLNLAGQPGLSRVTTSSPTVAHASMGFPIQGMSGQIERPVSAVSSLSDWGEGKGGGADDNDDGHYHSQRDTAFSSGVPESVHEDNTWSALGAQRPWGQPSDGVRAPSSTYSGSNYGPVAVPPHGGGVVYAGPGTGPEFLRDREGNVRARSRSREPELSRFPVPPPVPGSSIPGPVGRRRSVQQQEGQSIQSDMSWLNLGTDSRI